MRGEVPVGGPVSSRLLLVSGGIDGSQGYAARARDVGPDGHLNGFSVTALESVQNFVVFRAGLEPSFRVPDDGTDVALNARADFLDERGAFRVRPTQFPVEVTVTSEPVFFLQLCAKVGVQLAHLRQVLRRDRPHATGDQTDLQGPSDVKKFGHLVWRQPGDRVLLVWSRRDESFGVQPLERFPDRPPTSAELLCQGHLVEVRSRGDVAVRDRGTQSLIDALGESRSF